MPSVFADLVFSRPIALASALWLAACAPEEKTDSPRGDSVRKISPAPETTVVSAAEVPSAPPGVEYSTDRRSYRVGDTITSRLVNASGQMIGYNLCMTGVEQQTRNGRAKVPADPHLCPAVLLSLHPGDTAEHRRAHPRLPRGVYRLRTSVEAPIGKARVDLATDPFTVYD